MLQKKNEWGFVGAISGTWFSADRKKEMLDMVEGAQRQGVSMRQSCKMLIILRRRVLRWLEHQRDGRSLANGRPGSEPATRARYFSDQLVDVKELQ
jgi:hypothetical protein